MWYRHTHVSRFDQSPAMLVSSDETTMTMVNEDGFEWTDPIGHWLPID